VFAGCGMGAYFAWNVLRNRQLLQEVGLFLLRHTGNDKDFLATRASYCLDLRGPSVNVQTACSTSLVAIHLAAQSLLSGECDMALAGGVTIELPHHRGYLYTEGEILSPDGHCRAFDHRSRGTIFGSGAGVVVLRRLEDALRDKDHIRAVIKGTAVNNDGARKVGYLAPSVDGQAAAIAEALTLAGVEPRDVSYVECHGTGTAIGDPIEVSALAQVFADVKERRVCGLGSVKTNIGHLDTAAGVASFIKACLALQHGALPPSLHFEAPNPLIDFERTPFFVNDRLRPWPRGDRPRIAGVTSLGVGGTNAHVVVAEAPLPPAVPPTARPHHLLVWSAKNQRSLDDYAQKLAAHLRAERALDLGDVAATLAFGRHAFPRRRVAVARDHAEALRLLEGELPQRVHTHTATPGAKVVFLLPGGGAQYRHMARGLYRADPDFRADIDRGLELIAPELDVDLREIWLGDALPPAEVEQVFDRPSVQLPAIFLVEHALAQSWLRQGVRPAALLGHSVGENTAACLAGVFAFADALRLVALRGRLFERVRGGGMVSVPMAAERCRPLLTGNLDLATVNAKEICVVAGPDAELDAFAQRLAQQDIEVQRVRINIAAHSRLLAPILGEFGAFLRTLQLRAPQIPFVSNRTGTWITAEQATDPQYWVDHLRNTVQFATGIDLLLQDAQHVFLEVGPGRTLSSLARSSPSWNQDRSAIPSLRHPDDPVDDETWLTGARGRLWAAGVELPLSSMVDADRPRLSLPTYAFRQQRYWVDADAEGPAEAPTSRIDDVGRWLWLPKWSRVDAPAAVGSAIGNAAGTWLVFLDEAGVAGGVAARLRERGSDVVEVVLGDAFQRLSPQRFALAPELGREGYDALLRELAADGKQIRSVLHAWSLTTSRSFRPGSNFFHRCEEQGFYSLLFLAQALAGEDRQENLHLVVLANGLMGPELAAADPEKALLLGPCLVLPRELPRTTCAVVDLPLPPKKHRRNGITLDTLVDCALREVNAGASGLFAWRDGQRFGREHTAGNLPPTTTAMPRRLRERGTYLITGGLGGIGSLVAEWLARTCRARLVLVGRRPLPPRERWDEHIAAAGADDDRSRAIQKVRLCESFGAEVLPFAADVANVADMRTVVATARDRFGAIHGAIHAAGVIQDELIAQKEQAVVERVLAPKVQGAMVLAEVLGSEPTDFLVLFSSTSAVLGPPGQVDYVAANAFLDAFARSRSAAGRPTTALQWGTWNRVGMTAGDNTASDAEGGRPEALRGPLFQELIHQNGNEKLLRGQLASSTTWLLDEHRTREGHALIPGTGFIEMAAQSLAAIGEHGPFEVRDLWFFRPLHVPDGETRQIRVGLATSIEGYDFRVESESTHDDGQRGWQTHAQARLLLRALPAATAAALPTNLAATMTSQRRPSGGHDFVPSPQEAHLRFGRRWQVVRAIDYGPAAARADLALAAEFAADLQRWHLHPALLDLATGFAMELIPGYEPSRLWVPLCYRSIRVHDRLPAAFTSIARRCTPVGNAGDIVALDLTLVAPDGRVLVEVEGFQMKRLAAGQAFALAPAPTRADLRTARAGGPDSAAPAKALLAENIQRGIQPPEGVAALARLFDGELAPECMLTPIPLPSLRQELDRAQVLPAANQRFVRPELDSEYQAPRDEVEQALVRCFEELLGIDSIGVRDDFFALGGHSLIAVRLFAKIKKAFRVDYPMSVLFEAPTIERLAALMRRDGAIGAAATDGAANDERQNSAVADAVPHARYRHLVAMHPSRAGQGTPFFLVAGMFGNVMNLRHLAQLVGTERAFYGLQARGLFGDMAPHATFEAAAADYLAEVRAVQPHGPYLLGGFSGGGITAYEMARQLLAAGETVALLALLDSPLPTRSVVGRLDRVKIQVQRARREGPVYVAHWLQRRWRWEMSRLRRRFGPSENNDGDPQPTATFHSRAVEAAFRTALAQYRVEPLPVRTWLFRPQLDTTYDLGRGRFANKDRELVLPDNGWTAFVPHLQVIETPGDHDSMVLEPNVRVLATALRQAIETAVASDTPRIPHAPAAG
jgi:acyl transferase domain-containing protein/acyl carrier protein